MPRSRSRSRSRSRGRHSSYGRHRGRPRSRDRVSRREERRRSSRSSSPRRVKREHSRSRSRGRVKQERRSRWANDNDRRPAHSSSAVPPSVASSSSSSSRRNKRSHQIYLPPPTTKKVERKNENDVQSIMRGAIRSMAKKKRNRTDDSSNYEWGKKDEEAKEDDEPVKPKKQPSLEPSGKLFAEENKVNGITVKYVEPADARMPSKKWRLYVFKGDDQLDPLHIHRKSMFLFGREPKVCDIPLDHLSVSKQHAVLQYRHREKVDNNGTVTYSIKPYIMDLESTNGTKLNGEKINPAQYYELFPQDTLNFGFSSRDYVLIDAS